MRSQLLRYILVLLSWMPAGLHAQLRVHPTGKVTIGTTTASSQNKLMIHGWTERALLITANHPGDWWQSSAAHVSRALTVSWVVRWNNMDRFWVQGNGTVIAKDAYFWSDARLKQDVLPITAAMERIQKIQRVSFAYKPEVPCEDCGAVVAPDSTRERHYGLIAQEVEKVFPEIVKESPDKLRLLSYHQLVPVLVEALKEQQSELSRLRSELDTLKESVKMKRNVKKTNVE